MVFCSLSGSAVRNNVIAVVNESSKLVQVARIGTAAIPLPPSRPSVTGTISDTLTQPPVIPPNGAQLDMAVDPPDGAGGPLTVINSTLTLNYGAAAPAGADNAFVRWFLEAAIRAAAPDNPLFSGATVTLAGGRFHVRLGRNGTGVGAATTVSFADHGGDTAATDLQLTAAPGVTVGPQQLPLPNGSDSGALTEAALRGVRANKTTTSVAVISK